MLYEEWCEPDEICSSDSSLQGCGGFWQGKYFHTAFPQNFQNDHFQITILEMFAVIICLKLWGYNFKGKKIQMSCHNQSICQVVNSGKAKDEVLQDCLKEWDYKHLLALDKKDLQNLNIWNNIHENLPRK